MPRKGYKQADEHKQKLSEKKKGKDNPAWKHGRCEDGKTDYKRKYKRRERLEDYIVSKETKLKISNALKGRKRPEHAKKMQGENNPSWKGGTSFEPYCSKFNFDLKEKIRNGNKRKCILCGKSEILNGRKLSIHHIDGDKMQGCDGKKWKLMPLCQSCHSKCHSHPIKYEFLISTNC